MELELINPHITMKSYMLNWKAFWSWASSHQEGPLHCESSACVHARALITDLQTPANLRQCLPRAVRWRAKVRVGPNELLAWSQEFYEVPEVRPGLAGEAARSITR